MSLIPPRPVYTPRSGRSTRSGPVRQDMGSGSLLAGGTEVGAAAADGDLLNGSLADQARLAGPLVDLVLELEEAANAVSVVPVMA